MTVTGKQVGCKTLRIFGCKILPLMLNQATLVTSFNVEAKM